MTSRQQQVLDYIKTFVSKNGYSPSQQDMAEHFGITPQAVAKHLNAIEKKGYISRDRGSKRKIKIN